MRRTLVYRHETLDEDDADAAAGVEHKPSDTATGLALAAKVKTS